MKTSIALIGFMGTGKSSAGKLLAERLDMKFIETDELIQQNVGKTITEIFREIGEIGFREQEIAIIKGVASLTNTVIACGGGVVLNRINIDRLNQHAVIVCLTASPGVVLKRTGMDDTERPLLQTPDNLAKIRELYRFRRPFYQRAANIMIDTSKLTPEQTAESIIRRLKENAGFNSPR